MIDQTQLLNWIGGALIAVLIWLALGIFKRMDAIAAEQATIKAYIATEIAGLKELYHSVVERVIRLEERDKNAFPRPSHRASDPPRSTP